MTSTRPWTSSLRDVAVKYYDQSGIHSDQRHLRCEGFSAAWIEDADGNTMAITEVPD
jgi:hypothetical protein